MMQTHADINWTNISINQQQHTIMLFDLAVGGHHPSYISHLVEYWCAEKISGKMYVVVSPKFLTVHSDVVNIGAEYGSKNLEFLPITQAEYLKWKNQPHFFLKIFQEWHLFCKYSRILKSDHSLLLYFDHFQLPLALGLKAPCSISGIYFRPTFHYDNFKNYSASWRDKLKQWRQKLILYFVLRNPQIKNILCLDNFAVQYINKITQTVKILPAADPVETYNLNQVNINYIKKELAIDDRRKTLLLFGSLSKRKGVYQVLNAIQLLSDEVCQQISLLLIGAIACEEKECISQTISAITKLKSIQIIFEDRHIPIAEVPTYFQIANFVLVPYQKHVGMSSVIVQAAAAQKPVLATNYGLIGKLVEEYHLGLTFDSTSPKAIAENIAKAINLPFNQLANRDNMEQLATRNSSRQFATNIFNAICK